MKKNGFGKVKKNPTSTGALPGIAKGGGKGFGQMPMDSGKKTAAVPKKMPKVR